MTSRCDRCGRSKSVDEYVVTPKGGGDPIGDLKLCRGCASAISTAVTGKKLTVRLSHRRRPPDNRPPSRQETR